MIDDVFIGEIRAFAFGFCPVGWAVCDGSVLSVNTNSALFSLLGYTFGMGKTQYEFALPDLRGAAVMHPQAAPQPVYAVGQRYGAESVTLSNTEIPIHNHAIQRKARIDPVKGATATPGPSTNPGEIIVVTNPSSGTFDQVTCFTPNQAPDTQLHPMTIGLAGSSLPHENRQPYLTMNYCIAVQGIYPT